MEDYNRVFFVCPALNTINVDGLNEYLQMKFCMFLVLHEISDC